MRYHFVIGASRNPGHFHSHKLHHHSPNTKTNLYGLFDNYTGPAEGRQLSHTRRTMAVPPLDRVVGVNLRRSRIDWLACGFACLIINEIDAEILHFKFWFELYIFHSWWFPIATDWYGDVQPIVWLLVASLRQRRTYISRGEEQRFLFCKFSDW